MSSPHWCAIAGSQADGRLRSAIEISRELCDAGDGLVERFVADARAARLSWADIGQLFGTSKQAAHKRYGAASATEGHWPGRWAPAARYALDRAEAPALELGDNYVGTEHLVIGSRPLHRAPRLVPAAGTHDA